MKIRGISRGFKRRRDFLMKCQLPTTNTPSPSLEIAPVGLVADSERKMLPYPSQIRVNVLLPLELSGLGMGRPLLPAPSSFCPPAELKALLLSSAAARRPTVPTSQDCGEKNNPFEEDCFREREYFLYSFFLNMTKHHK